MSVRQKWKRQKKRLKVTEKRDKVHEDKLKEIEEGHQRYLTNKAEKEQQQQEETDALGIDKAKSIKLTKE